MEIVVREITFISNHVINIESNVDDVTITVSKLLTLNEDSSVKTITHFKLSDICGITYFVVTKDSLSKWVYK